MQFVFITGILKMNTLNKGRNELSKVIIQECNSYNIDLLIDKIDTGIALLGGWDYFVKPGMKVLLKVNLIGPKSSDSAAVTHCEFVRAVTRILKKKGCIVWIGDSSGGAIAGIAPTVQGFKISGLEKVANEEGAIIKNFDREGVVEVKPNSISGEKMYLAKPMFDADLVINLPKFKTHTSGIYTGAIKNVFGCVPGLKKAEYHKIAPDPKDFGKIIADINQSLKIGLHIMDAVSAMCGEGPTAGEVYQANKILISTDPLALDAIAASMIGLSIDNIPILEEAKKRELGDSAVSTIAVSGDYNSVPELRDFKLPKRFTNIKTQNYKFFIKLIEFLKARPKINLKTCKKCNMCIESCPVKAIDRESKEIDYAKCIECMCCHELCMHKAVELKKVNPLANIMMKLYRSSYK
jgi:uncharacterized protein (DUF362 family)/NAD-dependent dihydropyrimidine dehydrogenase PreA subunit